MGAIAAVCRRMFIPELRLGGVPAKPSLGSRLFVPQWSCRAWVNRRVQQIVPAQEENKKNEGKQAPPAPHDFHTVATHDDHEPFDLLLFKAQVRDTASHGNASEEEREPPVGNAADDDVDEADSSSL